MKTKEIHYKPLPGTRRYLLKKKYSLWQGDDHILFVNTGNIQETYKRFYFKDIQIFLLEKRFIRASHILMLIIAFFFLFLGILIRFTFGAWETKTFFIFGFFLLFLCALDWFRDELCDCYVQTAVQKVKLPSLSRKRKAIKAIEKLTPHIEFAQKEIPVNEEKSVSWNTQSAVSETDPTPNGKELKTVSGVWHMVLYATLAFGGFMSLITTISQNPVIFFLYSIAMMGAGIGAIGSLVAQYETGLTPRLKMLTWGASIYIFGFYIMNYIVYFLFSINHIRLQNPAETLFLFAKSIPTTPWLTTVNMGTGFVSVGIGLMGLILSYHHYTQNKN